MFHMKLIIICLAIIHIVKNYNLVSIIWENNSSVDEGYHVSLSIKKKKMYTFITQICLASKWYNSFFIHGIYILYVAFTDILNYSPPPLKNPFYFNFIRSYHYSNINCYIINFVKRFEILSCNSYDTRVRDLNLMCNESQTYLLLYICFIFYVNGRSYCLT